MRVYRRNTGIFIQQACFCGFLLYMMEKKFLIFVLLITLVFASRDIPKVEDGSEINLSDSAVASVDEFTSYTSINTFQPRKSPVGTPQVHEYTIMVPVPITPTTSTNNLHDYPPENPTPVVNLLPHTQLEPPSVTTVDLKDYSPVGHFPPHTPTDPPIDPPPF